MDNMKDEMHPDEVAQETMESVGFADKNVDHEEPEDNTKDTDPYGIKKRLGIQAKKHQRQTRALEDQIANQNVQIQQLHTMMQNQTPQFQQPNYQSQNPNDISGHIQQAVSAALKAKEDQERQIRETQNAAYIHRRALELKDKLDDASDKYEDWNQVVKDDSKPFTDAMFYAGLKIDNPEDVFYKLGKNPDELARISRLHPLDQEREIMKLSAALMGGQNKTISAPKTMSQIKTAPIASTTSNNMSADNIRQRMKAGTWK